MEKGLENLDLVKAISISKLDEAFKGETVKIRGFVGCIRLTKYVVFITLRDQLDTIQCVASAPQQDDEDHLKVKTLAIESFVEIKGEVKVVKTPVKGCTKKSIELDVKALNIISPVLDTLPFSLKDACATEKERAANAGICNVSYSTRLDNRFLDFRMPQTHSIIRVIDGFMASFREYTRKNGFIEIKTTKIIQSGSEGGSNLFSMKYFDRTAYLAQSPQLYKQMAIAGGLKRVCEIGHVYRAEQSNINRYLSEFTGLDLEMELEGSYHELIRFIHSLLVHIFDTIKAEYPRELEIIREYKHFEDLKYEKEPVIITHREAVDLLKARNVDISYADDFSREVEKTLGAIVREKHGVDLFVVTEYPKKERAFYTYVDRHTGKTNSYDFIMRGEEILSGAQRVVNYDDLRAAVMEKEINPESIQFYLDCFKFGVPPHGGCGIGLERLLKSYFDFDDIRYFSLYPRDPNRLHP